MAAPIELPVGDRTIINTEAQITFVNSPIHLRLQNALTDATILSVDVWIWIWNGSQNKVLAKPNFTLAKSKVSAADDYITVPIGDLIKSFLEHPLNAPNTFQPNFVYNEIDPATMSGQGVFWQVVTDITSDAGTVRNNYVTNFATLGYRWNYEQNIGVGNNGLTPNGSLGFTGTVNRWYNPQIHDYFTQTFNLTNAINVATSANMITKTPVVPPAAFSRTARDPSLIIFLNKLGLSEAFTPHGKCTAASDLDFDMSNVSYRDPSKVDNSFSHSRQRGAIDVTQKYIINTGSLTEDMVAVVEELIYSPKVYLIRFKEDVQDATFIGLTVDSTIVTVDDTTITVDSSTILASDVGFFKTHQQIPVVITDSDFLRKSRVNDKNEINYNILFEETNNKRNNIR